MDENNLDSLLDELSSMDGELNENIDIDSGVDVDADDMDDISLDELDHLDGMDLGDLDFDDIDFDEYVGAESFEDHETGCRCQSGRKEEAAGTGNGRYESGCPDREGKSGECETRTVTGRAVGAGGQYRCFWRSRLADAGRYRVARGRVR